MIDLSQAVWRRSSRSGSNGQCVEVATVWRKSSRSTANGQCVEVATVWRKSSRSGSNGSCVEVATGAAAVALRDSKDPQGPVLLVGAGDWRAFLAGLPTT